MKVLINSDKNVDVNADLEAQMEADVVSDMVRFGDRLTRVEVHLRDDSAGRSTEGDIRCLIEARPAGQQPVAVTDHASTPTAAFNSALTKLGALLETKFGRMEDKDLRDTIRRS